MKFWKFLLLATAVSVPVAFWVQDQTSPKQMAKKYLENNSEFSDWNLNIIIHDVEEIDSLFFNFGYMVDYRKYLSDVYKYATDEMARCYSISSSQAEKRRCAMAVRDTVNAVIRNSATAASALIPESFKGDGEKRKALKVSFSFGNGDPSDIILYYDITGTKIWGDETACLKVWDSCNEVMAMLRSVQDDAYDML